MTPRRRGLYLRQTAAPCHFTQFPRIFSVLLRIHHRSCNTNKVHTCTTQGSEPCHGCRSWEADANALSAFGSGSYADVPIHCDLSEDDVLSLALLCDSAPFAGSRQSSDFSRVSKLEDPQLYRSQSEQTQIALTEPRGSTDQSVAARRESSCLLEEALTSIGMRQLLPQISVPRSPREYAYSQMQSAPSTSYVPYSSGCASVFVPCNDPQPLQVHCHPSTT